MVVGAFSLFAVGDVVRLAATADERRAELVGCTGTVVGLRPGDRRVMATVAFEGGPAETVLVHGVDEAEIVQRYHRRRAH